MLTIAGSESRTCDGVSRRGFLHHGCLALGGLSLPEIPRAQATGGEQTTPSTPASEKTAARPRKIAQGVIMVLLPGGPSHLDTFDLKPDAPAEIRGAFRPLATNVPGIDICELLPRLAKLADKYTFIRFAARIARVARCRVAGAANPCWHFGLVK